jgi:hypothetical protein
MSNATTDRIYNQLFPPTEESEERRTARQAVAAAVKNHLPQLEQLLGLPEPSSQFRQDLIEAILDCTLKHKSPPKRASKLRKELKDIREDAARAEKINQRLNSRLQHTSAIYPPIKYRFLQLEKHTPDYAALANLARAHLALLPDLGGQRGFIAFQTLVGGLAYAFENATTRRASDAAKYNANDGHEGLFFDFVQAILPIVHELAPGMPGPDSRLAEDTYVFESVSSLRRSGELKRTRGRRRELRKSRRKVT